MSLLSVWFWLCASAWADSDIHYLESSAFANRSDATRVMRMAAREGLPGRVVRLYVPDVGWRYVFRSVDGERSDVGDVARELVSAGELALFTVRAADGVVTPLVGSDLVNQPMGAPDGRSDVAEILSLIARAHGGPVSLEGLKETPNVLFRFLRETSDRAVEHVYARRGADLHVSISVKSGTGVSSEFGLVEGTPWLKAEHEEPLDAGRVRRAAERFSPTHVLGLAGDLMGGVEQRLDARRRFVAGEVSFDQGVAIEIRQESGKGEPQSSIFVDRQTWRLTGVSKGTEDEQVRWMFLDYAELGNGMAYPSIVEVSTGSSSVDRIQVLELDLDPTMPPEWFPVEPR